MKANSLTFILLLLITNLFAQNIIDDQLVIRLHPDADVAAFEEELNEQMPSDAGFEFSAIAKDWQMYSLKTTKIQATALKASLRTHSDVASIGYDFQVEERDVIPNDLFYTDQWDMDAINAPAVWEFVTGGLSPNGDTIVVANLEYTDLYHEDLVDNIWINHKEIPDDGEDNDGNGYTDDYFGWNAEFGGDVVDQQFLGSNGHGTQTSGIIAAKGNNNIGISGVNWNVKLMVVSSKLIFSDILASYYYIYDMRKLYNDTNGEKGAFIVSTNASFGTDGFPTDNETFMEWCSLYDSLGQVGILSIGATSNDTDDIDIKGDMPTSCPSDFLITVTNVTKANIQRGGYSVENIDLGAPGAEVTSTRPFDDYSTIGGTSSAAPHVTGGIALLYSVPCEKWAQVIKEDPSLAASIMKGFILDGTTPLTALEDKTVSGGMLDLKGSFDLLQNYCGSSTGPLSILEVKTRLDSRKITVDYQTPASGPYVMRVYDAIGRLLKEAKIDVGLFEQKTFDLEVQDFATGVYFLSIENDEDIQTKPFVVY
ncbi:MAG: S8 family serine peptidase [Saprospiraceae bacterium]